MLKLFIYSTLCVTASLSCCSQQSDTPIQGKKYTRSNQRLMKCVRNGFCGDKISIEKKSFRSRKNLTLALVWDRHKTVTGNEDTADYKADAHREIIIAAQSTVLVCRKILL